jgi:hypothetical protein
MNSLAEDSDSAQAKLADMAMSAGIQGGHSKDFKIEE